MTAAIIFAYLAVTLIMLLMLRVVLGLFNQLSGKYVPVIPLPVKVIPAVMAALDLTADSVMYDLGCGDGRILRACHQRMPQASYVGIEKSRSVFALAKWKSRQLKGAKFQLRRQDFFRADLSPPTHVFTYLFPSMMQQLLPRLKQELRPGTRLVSVDFSFDNKKPVRVIDLKRSPWQLGQKIYIYQF